MNSYIIKLEAYEHNFYVQIVGSAQVQKVDNDGYMISFVQSSIGLISSWVLSNYVVNRNRSVKNKQVGDSPKEDGGRTFRWTKPGLQDDGSNNYVWSEHGKVKRQASDSKWLTLKMEARTQIVNNTCTSFLVQEDSSDLR